VDDVVVLTTSSGPVHARAVVGADGSASRVGAHVGVRMAQVDLGLEVELRPLSMVGWTGRVHLDWGSLPGSYAWVFPKGDRLTVGVIAAKGSPVETRAYLDRFVTEMGLDGAEVERSSGHLTRCREPGSPLQRGRVLVCGDAAGLLEPWTREGISFALGCWPTTRARSSAPSGWRCRRVLCCTPRWPGGRGWCTRGSRGRFPGGRRSGGWRGARRRWTARSRTARSRRPPGSSPATPERHCLQPRAGSWSSNPTD
jgi:hypothetical protein